MITYHFLTFLKECEINLVSDKNGFRVAIGKGVTPRTKKLDCNDRKKAYLEYVLWVGFEGLKIANQELFNAFLDGLDYKFSPTLSIPKKHKILLSGNCEGDEFFVFKNKDQWVATLGDQSIVIRTQDQAQAGIEFLGAIGKAKYGITKDYANHHLKGSSPLPESLFSE